MISGIGNSANPPKYWFFLGGRDLEMRVIERLLKRKGQSYTWHPGVNWQNSGWSLYEADIISVIKEGFIPVGIELNNTKNPVPEGSIDIDHHNERTLEESSLEQVAALLGVKLSEFEMAVAANDKGHVRAMRLLGLTQTSIDRIRRLDRRTQGVTQLQDDQAVALVKKHCILRNEVDYTKNFGDINVINAGEVPYSAIADLMANSLKLLIYSNRKFCYYGNGVRKLAQEFHREINQGTFYHGGGDFGYFGLVEDKFSTEETELVRNKIVQLMKMPFSHHIFLLPFRWDLLPADSKESTNWVKSTSYEKRTNLRNLRDLVIVPIIRESGNKERDNVTKWNFYKFKNKISAKKYNELNYFHGFVRETLFGGMSDQEPKEDEVLMLSWNERSESVALSPLTYRVNILKENGANDKLSDFYDLELQEVSLNFYETGIAVMAFHLNNHNYPEPESILAINDFGRRLYPQFLSDGADALSGPMGVFLPKSIELRLTDEQGKDSILLDENWKVFDKQADMGLGDLVPFLPAHVMRLLGDRFHLNEAHVEKGHVLVRPLVDDRMFVLSWIGNQTKSIELGLTPEVKSGNDVYGVRDHVDYYYETNEWWNKYVFVDGKGASVANKNMLRELNRRHTYARFVEWGTLYGISRYSFVCLTNRGDFSALTLQHIQTVYFQLVMLCLVQRASVLSFSHEVTGLASQVIGSESKGDGKDRLLERFKILHGAYIRYVNQIYFREASTQEQGIELYTMLQKFMEIERDVKDLNREVDEMHQFVQMQEAEDRETSLSTLTLIGFLFVIPSLVTGYYGMNVFGLSGENIFVSDSVMFWKLLGLLCITVLLLFVGVFAKLSNQRLLNKLPIKKHFLFGAFFFLLLLLLLPFC